MIRRLLFLNFLLSGQAFAGQLVTGNLGVGTNSAVQALDVRGKAYISGNVGIGSFAPGTALDINGRARLVGIGTTVPQAACLKADGTTGYYTTQTFEGICL